MTGDKRYREHFLERTHCKRGHRFTAQTTKYRPGRLRSWRACRRCAAEDVRAHYLRKHGPPKYPKAACKWGHPMVGDKVRWRPDGSKRYCLACLRAQHVRLNEKRKQERAST